MQPIYIYIYVFFLTTIMTPDIHWSGAVLRSNVTMCHTLSHDDVYTGYPQHGTSHIAKTAWQKSFESLRLLPAEYTSGKVI